MTNVKMTRGISSDGKIISISTVDSGLQENCFCFDCGARLVARKGETNADHFSHYPKDQDDRECHWGYETELHVLAKEIIANTKSLELPIGTIEPQSELVHFQDIYLEQKVGKRIPDLVAYTISGDCIHIEIAVTHFCDREKINELKRNNINCAEVELGFSDNDSELITTEYVADALKYAPIKWLSLNNTSDIALKTFNHNKLKQLNLIEKLNEIHLSIEQFQPQMDRQEKIKNHISKTIEELSNKYTELKKNHNQLQVEFDKNEEMLKKNTIKLEKINNAELLIEKYRAETQQKTALIQKCNLFLNKITVMRAQLDEHGYNENEPYDINVVIERNAEYLANKKFDELCNNKKDIIERLNKVIREKEQDINILQMKNKSYTYKKHL